ncbi:MAG: 3-deoxy-7-phosphoheptulonate synthase [bacterium]|nr:3-deoxy-7-phosphoheptulonate synthase [bacterium]
MNTEFTHNINIRSISKLPSPGQMKANLPLTEKSWDTVSEGREVIRRIIAGDDKRMLVIVGPCSIHDTREAVRYAEKLAKFKTFLQENNSQMPLFLAMRVNCDKPRSRAQTNGKASWQGLFNDPKMDGSYDMERGFNLARNMMLQITSLGIPIATEMLEAANYQVIDDCISYVWLGARDSGSQDKKKIASGASTPVGFKNGLSGSVDSAIHAIEFARHPHVFAAPDDDGVMCRFATNGNSHGHLIHRGFEDKLNYDSESIRTSSRKLKELGLPERILVDMSHGNSRKDHIKQRGVAESVLEQIEKGERAILGVMYESYLKDGKQEIPTNLHRLRKGVSVTDACDGWERTEETLKILARRFSKHLSKR